MFAECMLNFFIAEDVGGKGVCIRELLVFVKFDADIFFDGIGMWQCTTVEFGIGAIRVFNIAVIVDVKVKAEIVWKLMITTFTDECWLGC